MEVEMTRSELRDEVRNNLKRSSDALSDTRINRWLNWAQTFIASLHTYREMKTKTTLYTPSDGTSNTVSFPSNLKDLYSITLQDGASSVKLKYIYPRQFDLLYPRPATSGTGRPTMYVDYGESFELYKIPDKQYTLIVRYSKYPSDMSSDTDEPTLKRKDALIVAVATVFGFWSLKEVEDAAYWGKEIVPTLFKASVEADKTDEDWTPIARPFRLKGVSLEGEWWKNPFIGLGR